jgi:hypothetical protein
MSINFKKMDKEDFITYIHSTNDLSLTDDYGLTPLEFALTHNKTNNLSLNSTPDELDFLIEHSDLTVRNFNKMTPFMLALEYSHNQNIVLTPDQFEKVLIGTQKLLKENNDNLLIEKEEIKTEILKLISNEITPISLENIKNTISNLELLSVFDIETIREIEEEAKEIIEIEKFKKLLHEKVENIQKPEHPQNNQNKKSLSPQKTK